MREVRFGVVGLGSMGIKHARFLASGEVPRARLIAVCSSDAGKTAEFHRVRHFRSHEEMFRSGEVDAVVVATPHLSHPDIGIAAFGAGLHLMLEKPIAISVSEAQRLVTAHPQHLRFGVMFNVRTRPYLRKVREMIYAGELGAIRRFSYTATEFFRTEAYYSQSPWRGTWAREGGGVLLNQAPHHLDLLCWFLGMPSTVRGFCRFGKYHDIEVEDEATAYLEYDNGATGTFVTSAGENPGTTRIEIAGDLGRVIVDNEGAVFTQNECSMREFSRTAPGPMDEPRTETRKVDAALRGGNYAEMLTNFADAIIDGKPLIAAGEEGMWSLELANAILLSSLRAKTIQLPINPAEYSEALKELERAPAR